MTVSRHQDPLFGFYLIRDERYWLGSEATTVTPSPIVYDELVQLPHEEALVLVNGFNEQVRKCLGVRVKEVGGPHDGR